MLMVAWAFVNAVFPATVYSSIAAMRKAANATNAFGGINWLGMWAQTGTFLQCHSATY